MDKKTYQVARENRDHHFNGRFVFAVKTTGIFCKPSCPSPKAKEKNVEYFEHAYQAMESGYRPCLRCQPELEHTNLNDESESTHYFNDALLLIESGFLDDHTVGDLAKRVHCSERHLRHAFKLAIGLSPTAVNQYSRILRAKKWLMHSAISITDVAHQSGFGSIRQFNHVFGELMGMTPKEYRKKASRTEQEHVTIHTMIPYELPFEFKEFLHFMKIREMKGVEVIQNDTFSRTFRYGDSFGYFSVSDVKHLKALSLTIKTNKIQASTFIIERVKAMFDLSSNIAGVSEHLGKDPRLLAGMIDGIVPRLPIAFNAFEFGIRAILGQQVSIKAATTFASRIAYKMNKKTESWFLDGLDVYFPNAEELSSLDISDLGIITKRRDTITRIAEAVCQGDVSFSYLQDYETFYASFVALKGIGPWTANYVGLRGLGYVDAFPDNDLGVIQLFTIDGIKPKKKDILKEAEAWKPYRGYAALCIWRQHGKVD